MNTALDQIRQLPIVDRLQLIEQVWDDIHESEETQVIQNWHRDETRRRAAELETEPNIALTREELWQRVGRPNG